MLNDLFYLLQNRSRSASYGRSGAVSVSAV